MKGGKKVNDFEEIYEKYFKDVYKYILSLYRNVDIAEIEDEKIMKNISNQWKKDKKLSFTKGPC